MGVMEASGRALPACIPSLPVARHRAHRPAIVIRRTALLPVSTIPLPA